MEEKPLVSPTANRIATIIGVVSLVSLLGYAAVLGYRWKMENTPPQWSHEDFEFDSGPIVQVFIEPQLVFFLGDEGPFDHIGSHGWSSSFCPGSPAAGRGSFGNGSKIFGQYSTYHQGTTMQFLDGKCEMKLNAAGTRLTLSDGRKFNLKKSSPLWLRIKDDGTVIELNELPEGFVDFFESPPPDPGLLSNIKSYPDAFRKK